MDELGFHLVRQCKGFFVSKLALVTLLFLPGWIKRGLKPREDVGSLMNDGKDYTLRIDSAWRNADRQALVTPFGKKFRVTIADAKQPALNNGKYSCRKSIPVSRSH